MDFFGPPDIGKLKSKRDIKGLTAAIKHRDAEIRKNAALALAELASARAGDDFDRAVAPLISAFEDPTTALMTPAIIALGAIGQPALLPLISALRAPGARTREGAAQAMRRLKAIEPAYLRLAIDPLVILLRDPHEAVRLSAAGTLGRLGPQLEMPQRSLPTQTLILSIKDASAEVREATVAALGHLGDGQAIPPLIGALEDPCAAVRKNAGASLQALGWQPVSAAEFALFHVARQDWQSAVATGATAIPALVRILAGSDSSVSVAALNALGKIPSPDVIAPLVAALKSPDELVRASAAAALEAAGAPEAIPALLKAIHDKDSAVRKAVVRALGHSEDPRASAVLVNLLRMYEPDLVSEASAALVNLGTWALPDLLKALSEPGNLSQERIPPILVRIGAPAVFPLIEILHNLHPPADKLAVYALGEIGNARAVLPLATLLQDPALAIPAAQALGKIGDSRAVKALLELLGSYSEVTQQAAVLALGAIGDPLAVDSIIQLLRSSEYKTRTAAASALLNMYRSNKLDFNQKRKILEHKDQITVHHSDSATHQDENRSADWHSDQVLHEDLGIGLDFPTSMV